MKAWGKTEADEKQEADEGLGGRQKQIKNRKPMKAWGEETDEGLGGRHR